MGSFGIVVLTNVGERTNERVSEGSDSTRKKPQVTKRENSSSEGIVEEPTSGIVGSVLCT